MAVNFGIEHEVRRVRAHELPQRRDQITALCGQTQRGVVRHDHTPLKSEAPDRPGVSRDCSIVSIGLLDDVALRRGEAHSAGK